MLERDAPGHVELTGETCSEGVGSRTYPEREMGKEAMQTRKESTTGCEGLIYLGKRSLAHGASPDSPKTKK